VDEQPALARFRRMLGLFASFYVLLHFLAYAWLDMGFDPDAITLDIPSDRSRWSVSAHCC
jgi:sulfoxide reductase heme-binding subunit YedZ